MSDSDFWFGYAVAQSARKTTITTRPGPHTLRRVQEMQARAKLAAEAQQKVKKPT